jgi:hypothetical protein
MNIDGGCFCGHITYDAEADPALVMICHCTDCQTLTGSAFRTVILTREDGLVLRSGAPKIYVKTAENGNKRLQAFCPECGTPIYSTAPGDGPKVYVIRLGTVRQRDQLVPKTQIWSRSAQQWLGQIGAMRTFEKEPVFDRASGVD